GILRGFKMYFRLNSEQVKSLSFGARSTYYSALFLATSESRLVDRDVQLFDVIPPSTFYRHKKEIFEKTGLDLKDMFPSSSSRYTRGTFV
ncbi:hypothetical protein ACET70_20105, partial [Aeromonas caviae]|uniref:hypothetical protein n=1 Tax=Aeromonas caviae TaxID=648 RepID=UPI0038D128B4